MGQNFIYYWTEYRPNTERGPIFQLNQKSNRMLAIGRGDTVTAITLSSPGRYALVARFLVSEVGENPVGSEERENWGPWFFRSEHDDVLYFDPRSQPSAEPLIRTLGLTTNGAILGASFQGRSAVSKPLAAGASERLAQYAQGLEIDAARTSLKAAAAWNAEVWASLAPKNGDAPPSVEKKEYLRELYVRDRKHVAELKKLYNGRCQVTGQVPLNGIAGDITEAHHIHWLMRGGEDVKENMVIVSPEIHRAIHASDASFDRSDMSFIINGHKLSLKLNKHL